MIHSPEAILKKYWGYDAFRPLQADIIREVLAGKDTLALMPTGGGKSICFQVPALCKPGICIVVSPLIALMKDQVHNLQKVGVNTLAIFSGMSKREIDIAFDNCVHGNVKLLYVSPERLQSDMAIARIQKMNVNLFAIDEAHCISQWGYDFRPAYLKIAELRKLHPQVPFMALTATATPRVVDDIQDKLEFKEKHVLQKSFYRENLAYIVIKDIDKRGKMLTILKRIGGTGIVYVNSRRMTKDVAKYLLSEGISADYYHAGLSKEERSSKQEAWIDSKTRIMVATNAFGMGIDHPHVRVVVHLHPPASLEAYFQEAGRGGRDGEKAYAILLYDDKDIPGLIDKLEKSLPEIKEIKQVYQALGSFFQLAVGAELPSVDFDLVRFCEQYKFDVYKTHGALKILQECNFIYLTDAVFVPSRLHVMVSREKLYEYLLKNEGLANLLRALLRIYQGVQDQEVSIDEYKLAKLLSISRDELIKQLNFLVKTEMISYEPSKDKPQLAFIGGRRSLDSIMIDYSWYKQRKAWKMDMLQGVINYLRKHECRSRLLLEYFGEQARQDCGVCDVCLHHQRKETYKDVLPGIYNRIKEMLEKEAMQPELLIRSFKTAEQKAVKFALQEMSDEEQIIRIRDKYHLNSNGQ